MIDETEDELVIDVTLPDTYMTPSIIKVVEFFEPYGGEKNPPLVMMMEGAQIEDIQFMNNKGGSVQHVKLTLAFGQYKWPALFWRAGGDRVGSDFDKGGDRVNVAFRLGRNYFRNQESLQLTIMDLKRTE